MDVPPRSAVPWPPRFFVRYFHDGAWWGVDLDAYDFADAEARCEAPDMKPEGQHMATIPCGPAAMPIARSFVRIACWLRDIIARSVMQG
jgi:hypothetical protein